MDYDIAVVKRRMVLSPSNPFFSIPAAVAGGISVNAIVTSDQTGTATGLTSTKLTIAAGSNIALVAFLAFPSNGGANPAGISITWDSVNMPAITGTNQTNAVNTGVAMFGLTNPNVGNKSLVASWTGTMSAVLSAIAYNGADQTGGNTTFYNGAAGTLSGSAAGTTITLTCNSTGDGINAVHVSHNLWTSTGAIIVYNDAAFFGSGANYGIGSGTLTATAGAAQSVSCAGCCVKAA